MRIGTYGGTFDPINFGYLSVAKDAGVYCLATAEGDQPRVRQFGTAHIFEGRLYIQTGKVKDVSKQLIANPKYAGILFQKRYSYHQRVHARAGSDSVLMENMPDIINYEGRVKTRTLRVHR